MLATTDQRWEAMVPRAPFDSKLKDVYSYKGTRKAAEDHLLTADVSPYDGRAALREARQELWRREREASERAAQRERAEQYRAVHSLSPQSPQACSAHNRPKLVVACRL